MAARLSPAAARVFSESARCRPVPGHLHAARDVRPPIALRALPVFGWRLAEHVAESAAEGAQAGEAHVEADLGHRQVAVAQQRHRALDAAALEVAVRRLAEGVAE